MAVPCTEHLFLMGRKGVGKSTLLRAVLEGKRLGGFFTRRITGIFERPSIHLLRAAESQQRRRRIWCVSAGSGGRICSTGWGPQRWRTRRTAT